jgi:hypothetical protein
MLKLNSDGSSAFGGRFGLFFENLFGGIDEVETNYAQIRKTFSTLNRLDGATFGAFDFYLLHLNSNELI